MSISRDNLLAVLFGLVFALIFAFPLLDSIFWTLASRDWEKTEGMVIAIENGTKSAEIRYKFIVDGEEFTGDTFAFVTDGTVHDKQLLNERYHVGGDIRLYFNPDNPSQSVVERRPLSFAYLVVPLALIVPLAVIGMFFYAGMSICNRSSLNRSGG